MSFLDLQALVLCVQGDYDIPLSVYYDYVFTAAEQSGAALMQPWELMPFHVPPGQPTLLLTTAHTLSDPHLSGHSAFAVFPPSGNACQSPRCDQCTGHSFIQRTTRMMRGCGSLRKASHRMMLPMNGNY